MIQQLVKDAKKKKKQEEPPAVAPQKDSKGKEANETVPESGEQMSADDKIVIGGGKKKTMQSGPASPKVTLEHLGFDFNQIMSVVKDPTIKKEHLHDPQHFKPAQYVRHSSVQSYVLLDEQDIERLNKKKQSLIEEQHSHKEKKSNKGTSVKSRVLRAYDKP